ncbi:MAG: bis(5'-nucleosyl)-tetraphosphatase (symmetrical) YqeK [Huintestinicola sp.]
MDTAEVFRISEQELKDIKDVLEIRLSKKRMQHSLNVADEAVKLAEHYGGNKEKAYTAGLIHDICKEIPSEEQLDMGMKCRHPLTPIEQKIPPLYHAAAAVWYAENALHIHDDDILNAVRYHTAARDDMSLLEEIVYMADLISADRSYKDAPKMRKLAYQDLDEAMLEALKFSLSDVLEKCSLIPESSAAAYNRYAQKIRSSKSRK